jgi:hypothetical protein
MLGSPPLTRKKNLMRARSDQSITYGLTTTCPQALHSLLGFGAVEPHRPSGMLSLPASCFPIFTNSTGSTGGVVCVDLFQNRFDFR